MENIPWEVKRVLKFSVKRFAPFGHLGVDDRWSQGELMIDISGCIAVVSSLLSVSVFWTWHKRHVGLQANI